MSEAELGGGGLGGLRRPGEAGEAGAEELLALLRREGGAVEESLDLAAFLFLQILELLAGFDAFGDAGEAEVAAEADDGADQGFGGGLGGDVAEEGLVDLDAVELEAAEVGERGPASAEVVEGEADAELFEVAHDFDGGLGVVEGEGFGQLEFEPAGFDAGFAEDAADGGNDVVTIELLGGDIDGHTDGRKAQALPLDGLAAGGEEDPAADVDHEAHFLEMGDEAEGRDHALGGVVPAEEGFEAGDAGEVGGHERLIVEDEFAAGVGQAEVVFDGVAGAGGFSEFGSEEEPGAADFFLGLVHGGVGGLEEGFRFFAIDGVLGDADAGGNAEVVAVDVEGLNEGGDDFGGNGLDVGGAVDFREADDKFVTAHAADDVAFAEAGAKAEGGSLEEAIAGVVAEGVVDVLEAVEVEHEDGDAALVAGGESDGLGDAVLEEGAIGEAGEAVVEGEVVDAGFGLLAVGDVAGDAHGADDLAAVIEEGDFGGEDPALVAIGPGFLFFEAGEGVAGGDNFLFVGEGKIGVLGTEEVGVGFTDGLSGAGEAEVAGQRAADTDEAAGAILEEDVVGDVVEEGAEEVALHLVAAELEGVAHDEGDDNDGEAEDDGKAGAAGGIGGHEAAGKHNAKEHGENADDSTGDDRDAPLQVHGIGPGVRTELISYGNRFPNELQLRRGRQGIQLTVGDNSTTGGGQGGSREWELRAEGREPHARRARPLPFYRGAEFLDDFGCRFAGVVFAVRGKRDGADAGVASAAVALADGGEVEHLVRRSFSPGIGADRNFGAEAGPGEADRISGLGVEIVRDELVVALKGVVGDVEVDGALFALGADADEVDGALVAIEKRRQEGGDERLVENLLERHLGEERDEVRDEVGVLGGLDDESELHGGLGHFDGGLGALVESAVHDVGPADELGDGGGVEAEVGGGDVGEEAGAGDVVGIVEAVAFVAAVGHAAEVVLMIFRSEEGGEVVIEPPGDFGRGRVLEVDDRVLVAGEVGLAEEGAGAVDEAAVFVLGVGTDALVVESAEERGRAGTVETLVVIEDPDLQEKDAPENRRPGSRTGIS